MSKYKKIAVTIEAVQFTGNNLDEIMSFVVPSSMEDFKEGCFLIHTLEGTMKAEKNDYIIKGVKGEFYPCKPDIFKLTYEETL